MNTVQQTLGDNTLFTPLSGDNEDQTYRNQTSQHIEPSMLTQGAGMMKTKYEVKSKQDVERLNNPYLLHPEDYETQQQLFDAIKHWWMFKYRKKESTIKDRLRYAQKMSEHPVFPVNWLKLSTSFHHQGLYFKSVNYFLV